MKPSLRRLVACATIAVIAPAFGCSDGPAPLLTQVTKPDTTQTDSYIPATGTATKVPKRVTAGTYPMDYYISVPAGWPGNRSWPVVVNITGSGRDYEASAIKFSTVRDNANDPFIIVTPVVLTNAGDGPIRRDAPGYGYGTNVWDLLDVQGRCAFDMTGIKAMIDDVRAKYAGQPKAFMTAFSGGGNTGWAKVLLKPEQLRAAAIVSGNYDGRCITSEAFTPQFISTAAERVSLPVRGFMGASDGLLTLGLAQQTTALNLAKANGFTNTSAELVQGYAHDPMPSVILAYFRGMLSPSER